MIYGLVATTETRLYLYISLRKDEKPQKAVFTTGGLGGTSSQLKREYTEALEEYVRRLTHSREQGNKLGSAGCLIQCGSASLQVSRTWHTNGRKTNGRHTDRQLPDGTYAQNAHTLRMSVPYEVHRGSGWNRKRDHSSSVDVDTKPLFIVSFADHESKELASRHSLTGSLHHICKSAD